MSDLELDKSTVTRPKLKKYTSFHAVLLENVVIEKIKINHVFKKYKNKKKGREILQENKILVLALVLKKLLDKFLILKFQKLLRNRKFKKRKYRISKKKFKNKRKFNKIKS